MKRAALLAFAGLGLTAAAPAPQPFRIAVIEAASAPCGVPAAGAPAGEKAYFELLSKRMGRAVLACPVANATEAAQALAAGKLDMAPLDGASYEPVKASVRATMTVRAANGLVRTPVIMAVLGGKDGAPAALKGRTVAYGGASPSMHAQPKEVLAEQGYGDEVLAHELVAPDEERALEALRGGKAEAVVLHATAWRRQCRGSTPLAKPCADLKVIFRARPKAERAFAVRRDMTDADRFRLIGVHVAMHLEDKPAFDWAASQLATGGADFEPAEAEALTAARQPLLTQ